MADRDGQWVKESMEYVQLLRLDDDNNNDLIRSATFYYFWFFTISFFEVLFLSRHFFIHYSSFKNVFQWFCLVSFV